VAGRRAAPLLPLPLPPHISCTQPNSRSASVSFLMAMESWNQRSANAANCRLWIWTGELPAAGGRGARVAWGMERGLPGVQARRLRCK
jgi:hypothetical protein